jgi:hemerythrin-like domain-containing protein
MREEHREILERCFRLLSLLHDWKNQLLDPEKVSKFQHLLLEVVNSFWSHVRREEQVLYPMAQICLRDEQREEIKRRVKGIKLMERTFQIRNLAMDALVDLMGYIKTAHRLGKSGAEWGVAWDFQRKAQFLLDFVEAENSTGFHAPNRQCGF